MKTNKASYHWARWNRDRVAYEYSDEFIVARWNAYAIQVPGDERYYQDDDFQFISRVEQPQEIK